MLYQCTNIHCQSEYPTYPVCCVTCGNPETRPIPMMRRGASYGSEDYRTHKPLFKPLQNFHQLEKIQTSKRYTFGGFSELRLPLSVRIAIEGLPGTLKSTFGRRCSISCALQGAHVLYLSTEEGLDTETFQKGMNRAKTLINQDSIPSKIQFAFIDSASSWQHYERTWGVKKGLVVVDSISMLKVNKAWLEKHLKDSKHGYIFVEHLNTAKQPKGGLHLSYLVDVIIRTSIKEGQSVASVTKNRFGVHADININKAVGSNKMQSKVVQFPTLEKTNG